jgi:SAM-dependent methyltransferase
MAVDFAATAEDYRRHRAGFPASFFDRLAAHGIGHAGQWVVDLGTGTGTLARGFARRGCRVIGLDSAAPMLAQAREIDRTAGIEIDYREARAEDTGLPEGSADVVAAGQCWHWFDRRAAAREAARVLRTNGRMLIAHFDWIPLPGNLARATEELIEAHNPSWRLGNLDGIHPRWLRDLGEAGFRGIETFSYDVDVPYTSEAWRGRIRASAGVGASLPVSEVTRFDRELAALLADRFPSATLLVPHRVFAVIARPPMKGGQ